MNKERIPRHPDVVPGSTPQERSAAQHLFDHMEPEEREAFLAHERMRGVSEQELQARYGMQTSEDTALPPNTQESTAETTHVVHAGTTFYAKKRTTDESPEDMRAYEESVCSYAEYLHKPFVEIHYNDCVRTLAYKKVRGKYVVSLIQSIRQ